MMSGARRSRQGVVRWTLVAAVAATAAGLSGCKTNSAETAWQLMQQQQQEQAMARQKEDEAEGRRRPKEPEMILSLIAEAQPEIRQRQPRGGHAR
ncbi:hypothetical protein G6F66_015417 [Rhizopus arrhizus]|nr:hypothetical protein G6F66_015417 [Rhizopus arrhizus]